MRARLLALAAVAAAALSVGVAAAAGFVPSSSYEWQQPGASPVTTPYAHPQQPFPTPTRPAYASSSYVWVQPGTALPDGVTASLR